MLRQWSLFTVAFLALMLPACNQGSGKIKVAVISNNPEAFWTIAESGAKKAALDHDVELVFGKPAQGDVSVQKELIDTIVNQGVKGIAISVIDPKNQRLHLNEVAKRVALITQDNDAPDSARRCYLGTNNYEAGRAAGKLVKEALPQGGTIVIFVGQMEPLNARQRRQGVLDELAGQSPPANLNDFPISPDQMKYGNYELLKTYTEQPVGGTKCQENAISALAEVAGQKDVCFVGLWAYNPPALLTAVKDQKRLGQVRIVGFDEDVATVQGILDGHIHGTIVQNPYQFGYESVRILAGLARNDPSVLPKDGIRYFPHRIVTKDGGEGRIAAAEFMKDLKVLLGQK
jgi:ribose transport system substrate-binding protein